MINESLPNLDSFKNQLSKRFEDKIVKKIHRANKNYLDKFQFKYNNKEQDRPYHVKRKYKQINKNHIYKKLSENIFYEYFTPRSKYTFPCGCSLFYRGDFHKELKFLERSYKEEAINYFYYGDFSKDCEFNRKEYDFYSYDPNKNEIVEETNEKAKPIITFANSNLDNIIIKSNEKKKYYRIKHCEKNNNLSKEDNKKMLEEYILVNDDDDFISDYEII